MTKRFLLIFLLIPYCSFAQFMVGVSGGPELGKINTASSYRTGYDLGVNAGKFINYNLWLSAGLTYSKNSYHTAGRIPTTYRYDYLELPLLVHFRTGDDASQRTTSRRNSYFGFSAFGGVVPATIYDLKFSNYAGNQTIEKSALKQMGYTPIVNLTAGAGIYYQYSESMFFTVEPTIKYSLTQQPKNSGTHIYTVGLNLNIWYQFGVF